MTSKPIRRPGVRRVGGLAAAALIGVVTLLTGNGTAFADAASTAPNIPRYVEQATPSQPGGYEAGYMAGLNLGKQMADTDFKHGQMSRAFQNYPTVSGNDPNYNYQRGVLAGIKEEYTREMGGLIYEAVSPALPLNPTPTHPYSPETSTPPSCGSCAPTTPPTSPNTGNPNTTGPSTTGPSTTGPGPVQPVV
ncbi:hypothetical protein ABZW30_34010 [Kitasatospora sp. NPDC004669]|uniref:hypothetical protein n=1 Tax=Kitasatospora sp. NPDC004669 TaxID=3154555 RepID=UPI0033A7FE69